MSELEQPGASIPPSSDSTPNPGAALHSRRAFLFKLSVMLNVAVGAVLAVPLVGYLLGPVLKKNADTGAWIALGSIDQFPVGETRLADFRSPVATFDDGDKSYLVVACIAAPTRVLRLADGQFTDVQVLDGLGARELAVTRCGGRTLLIRVNFILGTPADPHPELDSQVYEWDGGKLHEVATFPTCGGTDVAVLNRGDVAELIVTNSLTPELRFAAETVRYEFSAGAR